MRVPVLPDMQDSPVDGGGGDGGGGVGDGIAEAQTTSFSIIVTAVCASPQPVSEPRASNVIAVAHKMMHKISQDGHHPCDLPEDVAGLGPVEENDLRVGHEVQCLSDLHDPHRVRIVIRVKGECLAHWHRHDRGPLVHPPRQRLAANEPSVELHRVRGCAPRRVSVCSLHVRDDCSHHGWRGTGVACRVDLVPLTRAEVENSPVMLLRAKPVMAVAVMGLVPMSSPTEVLPVLVMPDLVRSANPPAVPR